MLRYWMIGGLALAGLATGTFMAVPFGPADKEVVRLDADDAATVSLGAQVYAANCAACHGVDLEGQPNWRQRGRTTRPATPGTVTGTPCSIS